MLNFEISMISSFAFYKEEFDSKYNKFKNYTWNIVKNVIVIDSPLNCFL